MASGGKRKGAGRHSKLNDTVIQGVTVGIRRGMTWEMAAECAGVGRRTHHRWIAKGRLDAREGRSRTKEYKYLAACEMAKSGLGGVLVERMVELSEDKSSPHTYRATKFLLERLFAKTFSEKQTLQVTTEEHEDSIESHLDEISNMTDEQLEAMAFIEDLQPEEATRVRDAILKIKRGE